MNRPEATRKIAAGCFSFSRTWKNGERRERELLLLAWSSEDRRCASPRINILPFEFNLLKAFARPPARSLRCAREGKQMKNGAHVRKQGIKRRHHSWGIRPPKSAPRLHLKVFLRTSNSNFPARRNRLVHAETQTVRRQRQRLQRPELSDVFLALPNERSAASGDVMTCLFLRIETCRLAETTKATK